MIVIVNNEFNVTHETTSGVKLFIIVVKAIRN